MYELAPATYPKPDENPVNCYLSTLGSEDSRRSMVCALQTIAVIATGGRCDAFSLPWHRLKPQHTAAIRARLAGRYSPATANHALTALRSVLKQCWRLGLIDVETRSRCCDLPPVKGETLPRGRMLTTGEIRALFETCANDHTPAGRRDAAIIAVLAGGGLRRSELVSLDLSDFDPETGALTVRAGKGGKGRISYATNGALYAMEEWLEVRGVEPGPLFCPINKGGKINLRRMSAQSVYNALQKRGTEAGLQPFSPHDLRRTFVSELLDNGADVSMVQQLAGHANVTTTQKYDRRPERAKQKAAELICLPFVPHGAK
ncbi:MAG: tyrosine-type recombinase/integrase [bacterium]